MLSSGHTPQMGVTKMAQNRIKGVVETVRASRDIRVRGVSASREETVGVSESALIDLIYQAAVDPALWKHFVRALSESCGGAATAISLRIPSAGMPIHSARVGLLDEYAPVFTKHLRRGLPWGSLVLPLYTRGFAFGSDVLVNEKLPESRYYREYMEPQGLAAEGPLAHTFAESGGSAVAAVVAPPHDSDKARTKCFHLRWASPLGRSACRL